MVDCKIQKRYENILFCDPDIILVMSYVCLLHKYICQIRILHMILSLRHLLFILTLIKHDH